MAKTVVTMVIWWFPKIGVPPVLIHFRLRFSLINHPLLGYHNLWNPPFIDSSSEMDVVHLNSPTSITGKSTKNTLYEANICWWICSWTSNFWRRFSGMLSKVWWKTLGYSGIWCPWFSAVEHIPWFSRWNQQDLEIWKPIAPGSSYP